MILSRGSGHQCFKLLVLVSQLPQLSDLWRSQLAVLALPTIERLFCDLQAATDLCHWCAGFGLPKGHGDLLLGKSLSLHRVGLPGLQMRPLVRPLKTSTNASSGGPRIGVQSQEISVALHEVPL